MDLPHIVSADNVTRKTLAADLSPRISDLWELCSCGSIIGQIMIDLEES